MDQGRGRDEDIPEQEDNYWDRNLLDEIGPARAYLKALARRSPNMVREHRLVIAIDYGTTCTGQ